MKKNILCVVFSFLSYLCVSGMERCSEVTFSQIYESNKGLNGSIQLGILSYFPIEKITSATFEKEDRASLLKKDKNKISECRNGIVLRANFNSWLSVIDFQRISPAFKMALQDRISIIHAYGLQSPDAEKLAIAVSTSLSWTEGIALIRKVYGEGNGNHVNIYTLEDALFLIFLRISPPSFWDYPLLIFSTKEKKRRKEDECFFNNCMEDAIANYMEKVGNYTGKDFLDECIRRYRFALEKKKKN